MALDLALSDLSQLSRVRRVLSENDPNGQFARLDMAEVHISDDVLPGLCEVVERHLTAAGLRDRFEVIVDGLVAAAEQIPGKPRPDTYLRGAELLGVPADRCVVIEDAVSGVQAGAAGGFARVVGVDRGAGRETLLAEGADLVVVDLAELIPGLTEANR